MLNSASSIPFLSLLNYSPRGNSEISQNSRAHCSDVKAGRSEKIKSIIGLISKIEDQRLQLFFNKEVTLIPIPRSSLLIEGALWPTYEICKILVNLGYAKDVLPVLLRISPVAKSSGQTGADNRPTVEQHYNSLSVNNTLAKPSQITIVDDVLTLGRISFASSCRLQERFKDIPIRLFSIFKTQGFIPDIEKLVDITFSEITYNSTTGKTSRH